jgi:hypothetical protein
MMIALFLSTALLASPAPLLVPFDFDTNQILVHASANGSEPACRNPRLWMPQSPIQRLTALFSRAGATCTLTSKRGAEMRQVPLTLREQL